MENLIKTHNDDKGEQCFSEKQAKRERRGYEGNIVKGSNCFKLRDFFVEHGTSL